MADPTNTTQTPMDKWSAGFLAAYLVAVTVLTGYAIASLWSLQSPDAGAPDPPNCAKDATAQLARLHPAKIHAGSTAKLLILGCGFVPATTQVKINGAVRSAAVDDASHIRVDLSAAEIAAAGAIVVTVSNGGIDFGSAVLDVVPPVLSWRVFRTGPWLIGQELQLLLLVLFTGAFGSSIYALKSLADYKGGKILSESWFMFYTFQPIIGSGVAFLLYLLIRGGFLTGTGADAKTMNLYGICAIAGLAGAFSDIALAKLREVFVMLFKPKDDRAGKVADLKITTTALPDGVVGTPYKQTLEISGGMTPFSWSVSPDLPAPLTLDPATGTISGTPAAALPETKFTFTVTDSATPPASSNADLTLTIT